MKRFPCVSYILTPGDVSVPSLHLRFQQLGYNKDSCKQSKHGEKARGEKKKMTRVHKEGLPL